MKGTGSLAGRLLVVALATLLSVLSAAPAVAGEPPPAPSEPPPATVLVVRAPAWGFIYTSGKLTATLTEQQSGAPVVGAEVLVERWSPVADAWQAVGPALVTDGAGTVTHTYTVAPRSNRFRASFAGTPTHQPSKSATVSVDAQRIGTEVWLSGRQRVVDERSVRIYVRWVAADGRKVSGRVAVYRKNKGTTTWTLARSPRVESGVASFLVRPRVDTVWRVEAPGGVWFLRDTSPWHHVDNVPPVAPVALPAGAPRPSITLPVQPRAVGSGMNPVVTTIPSGVWRNMVGRSWHRGCPVGRADLRLVRMNYWGFDGYRHRGEMVLHRRAAYDAVGAFRELYQGRYRVRHMYRVDRFGYSSRLGGADDYASMSADNTSSFNCRQVVGRPGVRSPHSYGDAVDLNPWENPYVSGQGTVPNSWWLSRSHPLVAWRSWSHPVVRAFARHGFSWGGAYRDFHHFEQ